METNASTWSRIRAFPLFRIVGSVVVLVLAVLLGGIAVWYLLEGRSDDGISVRQTPDVIAAVRDLARLETTSYHIEKVIDLKDTQSSFFGLVQSEDAILLVAAGDVTAGVDLSELRPEDVSIDEKARTARIDLPRPRVLHTRIDNERTYVHSRQTDLLAERRTDLETRARQEAERSITAAALQAGILARAKTNAQRTVEALVRSLGYTQVEVRFAEE